MNDAPPGFVSADLRWANGVWLSSSTSPLEAAYQRVRTLEGRLLEDAIVRDLPKSGDRTRHAREWSARHASMIRLMRALNAVSRSLTVLEIGCGNGWLSARIAENGHRVVGLDVHLAELEQASRVFVGDRLWFVHGDFSELPMTAGSFDRIVLAASIQYFKDPAPLIAKAMTLLSRDGEIHVLDSPLYTGDMEKERAAERSRRYYARIDAREMTGHYHHHTLASLALPHARIDVRKPGFLDAILRRIGWSAPAFPHVVIRRHA